MTRHEEQPREQQDKQEYQAPEVRTEEVFETLAQACGKAIGQCQPSPGGSVRS
jgi:hypothetical protein